MQKLIIENRTELSMIEIWPYVRFVLSMGRVSNNETQYCYHVSFEDGTQSAAYKNKGSDRIVVYREPS